MFRETFKNAPVGAHSGRKNFANHSIKRLVNYFFFRELVEPFHTQYDIMACVPTASAIKYVTFVDNKEKNIWS